MDSHSLGDHAHHATGGRAPAAAAERRTRWVVAITLVMMVGELLVGWWSGSMALTADGWHMGTHAGALGLTVLAYWFARTRADHQAFTFGTGKVYALAGYSSGVLLGAVALWMMAEGLQRLFSPHSIHFEEALWVAILGLGVNLACAVLLGHGHDHDHDHAGHGHASHDHARHGHGHADHDHASNDHADHGHAGHDHDHDRDHGHPDHGHAGHDRDHGHPDHGHAGHDHGPDHAGHDHKAPVDRHGGDHNLRAAYLHVVADAFTSVLAIGALVAGRYAGLWYLDPAMGIVGGAVIISWAIGLCKQAAGQLLDVASSPALERWVRHRLEAIDDVRIADLHVWELGPRQFGCVVSIVTSTPREVDFYRKRVLASPAIAHLTVELHCCSRQHSPPAQRAG